MPYLAEKIRDWAKNDLEKEIGRINSEHTDEISRGIRKQSDNFALYTQRPFLHLSESTLKSYVVQEAIYAAENGPFLVLDMSYENKGGRAFHSLWSQVIEGLGYNMQHKNPFHVIFSSLTEASVRQQFRSKGMQSLEDLLVDKRRFDFSFSEKTAEEMFPHEQLVYLSPDAPKELHSFDPSKVYIIGGMVDLSGRPRESLAEARRRGIEVARFPFEKYLT